MANPASLTGRYLAGTRVDPDAGAAAARHRLEHRRPRRARATTCATSTSSIPLGTMTCVTGVSGSGKSTLVIDTLYRALARKLGGGRDEPGAHDELVGWQLVDKVIEIEPGADRAQPALESGDLHGALRPHPRAVRAAPGGARARLRPGPLLVQREGRALRGVRRRRRHRDRDALPARRVRDLRGVRRPSLRSRDARGEVQGPQHRRRARPDRRGGARGPGQRARRSGRASTSCATSGSTTSASDSRGRRCRAARRSG